MILKRNSLKNAQKFAYNKHDIMKKHFLLLVVLTFCVSGIYAAPIDPSRAINVAEQFMPASASSSKIKGKKSPQQASEIVYTHYMPKSGKPAIYVVNINGGFALVSADDVAHPVLGYNYGKPWPTDVDSIAPSVKGFLDDLAAQMEAASEHPQDAETAAEWRQPRRSSNHAARYAKNDNLPDSVGPLLTTAWDQGQYYNAMCPVDGQSQYDGRVLTGCGATAFAQIVKYWGDREYLRMRGIHSYESPYDTLTINFDSTSYDFAHMPNALTSESTPQEVNAIAKLMYECGVSINMRYGTEASSSATNDYRASLINFYGFSPDLYLEARGHYQDSMWERMLRDEITQGRPILYRGASTSGGHAFVCDGYKNDGFFHFNYGWSGNLDGWYRVSPAETDNILYSTDQQAILGIVPDSTGNVILGTTRGINTYQLTTPMRFYHIMGHTNSLGVYESADCMSENNFICDNNHTLVVDKVFYENQDMSITDEYEHQIALFYPAFDDAMDHGNGHNTFHAPTNKIRIGYYGSDSNYGFCFYVRTNTDCPAPANITLKRDAASIQVMWALEEEQSVYWEIEYGEQGFQRGEGFLITTDTIGAVLTHVTRGEIYDIYIRSICDESHHSDWEKFQLYFDPYWTDVVTEQPEGYQEDANGNVYISSAEGLSWLASKVNGLNGEQPHTFMDTTVYLMADIDLSTYRWNSIGHYFPSKIYKNERRYFNGTFEGNNHVISNLNIADTTGYLGLFGFIYLDTRYQQTRKTIIRNVRLDGGSVSCPWSIRNEQFGKTIHDIGALVGYGMNVEIDNCHSSVNVSGQSDVGSLCGELYNVGTTACFVQNSSATGDVKGISGCGGLIGLVEGNIEVRNCYASGNILLEQAGCDPWYRGGLIGNFMDGAIVSNCFSTGRVDVPAFNNKYNGKVIGCPYINPHIHYLYGLDSINSKMEMIGNSCADISDTTQFNHNGFTNTLHAPITIDTISTTNMLDALNAWVAHTNNFNLFTWKIDSLTGYPVFEKKYEPLCYNPTELIASNATIPGDTIIRTKLAWTQKGNSGRWEVLYVVSGQDMATGSTLIVNSDPCVLTNLPSGKSLDFYVRAICAENETSGWSELITYMPEKLRWTEVVTSKPEGYQEDDENIYIYSAEALAWLSKTLNILPEEATEMSCIDVEKNIHLMADIDLSAYRWTPLGWQWCLSNCNFVGHNHTISGLYCNELIGDVGLFGNLTYGNIINVRIRDGYISGQENAGLLIGHSDGVRISSCMIDGNVRGSKVGGGIVGRAIGDVIRNSCFIGSVSGKGKGGLCGLPVMARFENCYVVHDIANMFVGKDGNNVLIRNCYYKDFGKKPDYKKAKNYTTQNISAFKNQSDTWLLTTPPEINGISYSGLIEALNAGFNESDNAPCQVWVADTVNTNKGYPVFGTFPKYTVTFMYDEDSLLQTSQLAYGEIPYYQGATPTKEPPGYGWVYTFSHWAPDIEPVTGDVTYYPYFTISLVTEMEEPATTDDVPRKILRNGHIFILRGEKKYTLTGQEVK